jgi:thiamine-phosphate pyrophosphorylase
MRWNRDWGLYLVADETHFRQGMIEDAMVRALRGGVQIVQLREKHCSDFEFESLARRALHAARPYGVPVIVNDRVEVARVTGAHGVHLGQSDASPVMARQTLGADALIGWSVESEDQARAASALDVDYLGVSSVFATQTKSNLRRIWNLDGLRALRSITRLPLVGIGGISEDNAASVIRAGADAVAVISSFGAHEDWKSKAERLSLQINNARKSPEGEADA